MGAPVTLVDPQGVYTPAGTGTIANPSVSGGEYNSTAPTLTSGTSDATQFDSRGNTKVTLFAPDNITSPITSASPGDGTVNSSGPFVKVITYNEVYNGTTWDRARGDTIGSYTVAKGSAAMATNQVSVATTSTLIVAARTGRSSVTITNLGATDIFIGNTGVGLTTGTLLVGTKGAAITIPTSAAIYGIASVAQSVSFIENY